MMSPDLTSSSGARIESVLTNLTSGDIQEVWPELWVTNDLDYDRALQLIDAATMAEESPHAPWRCRHCGEENEGAVERLAASVVRSFHRSSSRQARAPDVTVGEITLRTDTEPVP